MIYSLRFLLARFSLLTFTHLQLLIFLLTYNMSSSIVSRSVSIIGRQSCVAVDWSFSGYTIVALLDGSKLTSSVSVVCCLTEFYLLFFILMNSFFFVWFFSFTVVGLTSTYWRISPLSPINVVPSAVKERVFSGFIRPKD